ncbi:hypothetical protein BFJ71_g7273 [Fusarium oxysporum]|nr:hypothetical protein BFJ71_g7273 [Fusarium oxysporum]
MFNNGSVAKTQTQIRTQSTTLTQIVAVNAICKEGLFQNSPSSSCQRRIAAQRNIMTFLGLLRALVETLLYVMDCIRGFSQ